MDLQQQHARRRGEMLAAIGEVIDAGSFTGGAFVERFEAEFADYCRTRHAVGVSSGTDALWLVLQALGIGTGDEVVTVPNSFVATAAAIQRTGARTVFADVDEDSLTMDPAALLAAITPRTKAVIVVHLFGRPADMDPILDVTERHGLAVIEDAAQAHGARYRGRRVGTFGDAACFSFYPAKNLGACGDAGAVVTRSEALRDRIMALRNHGQITKYHHEKGGWNCRMDSIQAAILSIKLRDLDAMNDLRRQRAADYRAGLAGCEAVRVPSEAEDIRQVYHLFAARVAGRDAVIEALRESGIHAGIHYPLPIHLQAAFRHLGYRSGSLPVTEKSCRELISLPIFPEMAGWQTQLVCRELVNACGAAGMLASTGGTAHSS